MAQINEEVVPLSGKVERSFAYFTIKDRLPVIITQMIDTLCRDRDNLEEIHGKLKFEEIKKVISYLSQLKTEIQTNKALKKFEKSDPNQVSDDFDDTEDWNDVLTEYEATNGDKPHWFTASWLLVECYMYKAAHYSLQKTATFGSYDFFIKEKLQTMEQSKIAIGRMDKFLKSALDLTEEEHIKESFYTLMQGSVWGNRYDLSLLSVETLTTNSSETEGNDFQRAIKTLEPNLVVNDCDEVYSNLMQSREKSLDIAIVLDNAGLELISDLCLALFLLKHNFANSISLYVKIKPWFVSDTTTKDLDITETFLKESGFSNLHDEWLMWKNKKLFVKEHKFWTTCRTFPEMKKISPDLYSELSEFGLIVFKGDLNYRKLVSDLDWPTDTPFRTALRSFRDVGPILALRTIKGGPSVGIDDVIKQRVVSDIGAYDWYTTGKCGMVQFSNS